MVGVIYKATCSITGKSYIGQTIHYEQRIKEHLKTKDGSHFHNALAKYGPDAFTWEILETCD